MNTIDTDTLTNNTHANPQANRDIATLAQAIESRDADAIAARYARARP